MNKRKLYQKAIEKWGTELQLDMMIEECAELTQAIIHFKRNRKAVAEIISEIADVKIMIEQMEEIFDKASIEGIVQIKLERLNKMIEKEENNERAKKTL